MLEKKKDCVQTNDEEPIANKFCCNPVIFWIYSGWNSTILSNKAFHACHIDEVLSAPGRALSLIPSFPFLNFQRHSFTVGYAIHAFLYTAYIRV